MQLIRWSFHNLAIPMIEFDDKELRCTSQALCNALGVSRKTLEHIRHRHPEHVQPVRPPERGAKEFLQAHRVEFGVERVREDMLLWSVDDMIAVAFYSTSKSALEFTKAVVQLVKREAQRSVITEAQYCELMARVNAVEEARGALQTAASAAGVALQAQKGTKHLRLI
jgi:hypothetical protein